MRSKVNFGHPKWPTAAILSKIPNKNKVAYRSEMARNAIESEFRTSKMGAGVHFVKIKILIDLNWLEIRSKVNLGHPKWPTAAILSKITKKKKLRIDLKWPEMWSKVNFGHPKWPTAAILSKISKKIKLHIDLKWPEMLSDIQNERRRSFCQKLICFKEMRSKVNFGHPKWAPVAIL